MSVPLRMTRAQLARLAARLERLAEIFRRKSDAAPVALGGAVIAAIAAGTFTIAEDDAPEGAPAPEKRDAAA